MVPTSSELARRVGDLPLEEVPCYLCGKTEGPVLVDDPPFVVRLCGCGLAYTSPRLDGSRIHEIYEGDAYFNSERAEAFGYSGYEEDLLGYLKTFERKASVIARHVSGGRVLEVGSAAGAFLKVMRDRGYEVTGLEISRSIVESSRRRFGFERLHCGRLDEAVLPDAHYDVVAMFDVIEHLSDPLQELAICRRLMKDDGVLVLQTQDVNSRTRKLLGRRWHHFKQLEHIYHFSPETLAVLLHRAGLEIVELTRRNAGKYVSLDFIAERANRVAHVPKFLCAPLRALGRRFLYVNPQDEMLVVARKRREGDT